MVEILKNVKKSITDNGGAVGGAIAYLKKIAITIQTVLSGISVKGATIVAGKVALVGGAVTLVGAEIYFKNTWYRKEEKCMGMDDFTYPGYFN